MHNLKTKPTSIVQKAEKFDFIVVVAGSNDLSFGTLDFVFLSLSLQVIIERFGKADLPELEKRK